jgi:magnesium and cobalt transporter
MASDDISSQPKSFLERISHFLNGEPQNRKELLAVLAHAHERNILDSEAFSIIQGAMQVSEMQVREIMIPRSQAVMVKASEPIKTFLPQIIESAHSRFPVLGENPDEVIGILIAKDLLQPVADGKLEKFSIKEVLRPATFVPESKRLNVLLREFRSTRNHMAIVVNEYGGIAGLVTIEDVLEQIVGEIEDEHDWEDEYLIKSANPNEFIVKALIPIDEFNEHFNSEFDDEDCDTIGGIVLQHFGHLPKRNETIKIDRFRFKVLNADNRAIRLLQVETDA